jgi:anti-sigma regulatory factor (Ser/Thr protein kinase)
MNTVMTSEDPRRFTSAYHPVPSAAGQARALLRQALEEWGQDELYDSGSVVLTEMISNAIRSDDVIEVEIFLDDDRSFVHFEVFDTCQDVPEQRTPDDEEENGRGLLLIELLAAKWGWRLVSEGKVVYALLETAG